MTFTKFKMIAAAALVASAAWAGAASATTCPTPGTLGVERFLNLVTDPGSTCIDSGTNAAADDEFMLAHPEYAQIAKAESETPNALDGIVDATTGSLFSGTSGVIDFTPISGYSDFVILFKLGHPATSESWFAFLIPAAGFTGGTWNVVDEYGYPWNGQDLSHTTLYGVSAVPIPAAGLLLIGALGGLVGLRRRRKAA